MSSAAEFWLEAVRQLDPERYLRLRREEDDYRLETRALSALREYATEKRILLIVENLDAQEVFVTPRATNLETGEVFESGRLGIALV